MFLVLVSTRWLSPQLEDEWSSALTLSTLPKRYQTILIITQNKDVNSFCTADSLCV